MANVTVPTNPSTTNNTLTVNFTTDVNNITGVQLTKDGSNYINATSFTNTSASFDVSSWSNGTYSTCYLKIIYTETSSGEDISQNALIYSLPSETTFTGSNYIDTGVQLLASNTDWTIFIDYQLSNTNSNNKQLFGCSTLVDGSIRGFYVYMYSQEVNLSGQIFDSIVKLNSNTGDTNRRKLAIRKLGSNIIVNHDTINTWDIDNGYTTAITYSSHTSSLLLGVDNTIPETFTDYFVGTIYQCKVYNKYLSDFEITTLLE